jgi:hypothetical protein
MNSFERRRAVEARRREAIQLGWIGAYELALRLSVSKRRALVLLQSGRVVGAFRDRDGWKIPVTSLGDGLIKPGLRGPKLRVKDKRRRRVAVYRI